MKERTRRQRLDEFEDSEEEKKAGGCRAWSCMMDAETWSGGEAQVGRGGGDVSSLGVAGAGMA